MRALELSSQLALRSLGETTRAARRLFIVDISLDPDEDESSGDEDPAVYVVVDGEDARGVDKDDLDSRRGASSAVLIRDARWPRWRWCDGGFCSSELNVALDELLEGPVGDTSTDARRFLT